MKKSLRGVGILLISCGILLVGTINQTNAAPITTPHENIPDFCANPTIISKQNGAWFAASTWNPNRIPTATDIVRIEANNDISFNGTATVDCLGIAGHLQFATDQPTKLTTGNILVYTTGYLEVGSTNAPIISTAKAEIIIADKPLNTVLDPKQLGTGLMVLGKITMIGAEKNPTFIRLATEPKKGDTTLTLEQAVTGWNVGDRLMLPGSDQEPTEKGGGYVFTHKWEELTIKTISSNGLTLGIETTASDKKLQYDHPGARDLPKAGQTIGDLKFLPHIGNLTRNIVVRSQTLSEAGKSAFCTDVNKLTGTATCSTRGHTMFTYRADTDVRYTDFLDLGRTMITPLDSTTLDRIGTNQIGRYPVHFHHLFGPTNLSASTPQFTFIGNAIDGGSSNHNFKWGVAIHDSHYGLFQDNVIYNMGGAGVMTEDGSETKNMIDHNFVVRTKGMGDRNTEENPTQGNAREGVNFYFRGPNNYVRNNVGANTTETGVESAYFMKYNFYYLGTLRIPNFKGADTSVAGQYTNRYGNSMPILENNNNEGYASRQGFTNWWTCTTDTRPEACDQNPDVPGNRSVIKDMKLWNISRANYYGYPEKNMTFDGWIVRGDYTIINEFEGGSFWWSDYVAYDTIIRNFNVQGIVNFILPYFAGGTTLIEDSDFGVKNGIVNKISAAPGSAPGANLPARRQIFKNVRYLPFPGQSVSRTLTLGGGLGYEGAGDLVTPDQTFVCSFNGNTTDNFQIFYKDQNPASLLPMDTGNLRSCMASISDSSGNANTGLLHGGPVSVAGQIGTAFGFDGTNDYISTTTDYGNASSLTTFSLSAWFKTTSTAGRKIVGLENTPMSESTAYDRELYVGTDGKVYFLLYDTVQKTAVSTAVKNDGQWHHAVGVAQSGVNMKLYVDGVLQQTTAIGTPYSAYPASYWRIGGGRLYAHGSGNDGFFNGSIDDVRVYQRALTATEAAQLASGASPSSVALLAHWKFDEPNNPTTSITNQACWDTYGKAYAGELAPCTTQRPASSGLTGYVCNTPAVASICSSNPDVIAPIISNIAASSITASAATISWTTNEPADTQVDYGTTAAYGNSTTLATPLITTHSQTLTGLTASTTYHYKIKSKDAAGNPATSADFAFTTEALPAESTVVIITPTNNQQLPFNTPLIIAAIINYHTGDCLEFLLDGSLIPSNAITNPTGSLNICGSTSPPQQSPQQPPFSSPPSSPSPTSTPPTLPPPPPITPPPPSSPTLPTPISYWKLDETTGTIAADSNGGNNGTLQNGPVWTSGNKGGALSFDGTDDYVSAPDLPNGTGYDFNAGDSFTLAAWIKPVTTAAGQVIVSKGGSGFGPNYVFEIALWGSNGNIALNKRNGGVEDIIRSATGVAAGQWSHVVAVKNGTTVTFYINGVNAGGGGAWDNVGSSNTEALPLNIGSKASYMYSQSFNGSIDDVRIFNRALTAQEINNLFTSN